MDLLSMERKKKHDKTSRGRNVMDVMVWNVAGCTDTLAFL
jgi:hypothetical protein